MAHVSEELRLVPARNLQFPALLMDLPEKARVLDRHRRVGGERRKKIYRLLRNGPAAGLVVPNKQADHRAARDHRDHGEARRPEWWNQVLFWKVQFRREWGLFGED
jgi:hypothetical protein